MCIACCCCCACKSCPAWSTLWLAEISILIRSCATCCWSCHCNCLSFCDSSCTDCWVVYKLCWSITLINIAYSYCIWCINARCVCWSRRKCIAVKSLSCCCVLISTVNHTLECFLSKNLTVIACVNNIYLTCWINLCIFNPNFSCWFVALSTSWWLLNTWTVIEDNHCGFCICCFTNEPTITLCCHLSSRPLTIILSSCFTLFCICIHIYRWPVFSIIVVNLKICRLYIVILEYNTNITRLICTCCIACLCEVNLIVFDSLRSCGICCTNLACHCCSICKSSTSWSVYIRNWNCTKLWSIKMIIESNRCICFWICARCRTYCFYKVICFCKLSISRNCVRFTDKTYHCLSLENFAIILVDMLNDNLALSALWLLEKYCAVITWIKCNLTTRNYACCIIIPVCDNCTIAPYWGNINSNILVCLSKECSNNLIFYIILAICSWECVTIWRIIRRNNLVLTCTNWKVVISECTDLLPVRKNISINRIPVHKASELMSCTWVNICKAAVYHRSVCFITVENLNSTWKHEEEWTSILSVTLCKNCIMRRNVAQYIEAIVIVDRACVSAICAFNRTSRWNITAIYSRSKLKVNHWVEATICIIWALTNLMTEAFTCHPEIKVVKLLCWIFLLPLFKSSYALSFKYFPCWKLNMLSSIATETINTKVTNPLCEPVWEITCNCVWSAIFAFFSGICTLFSPLCFKKFRKSYFIAWTCLKVRQACEWTFNFATAFFIARESATNPVRAPPFAP